MTENALREKVAAAIRDEDCCGATLDGRRVFCDDVGLDEPSRTCPCKKLAEVAIAVIREADERSK